MKSTSTKFERVLVKWGACEQGMRWVKARGHRSMLKAWDDSYNEINGYSWREWFVEYLLDALELWCADTGEEVGLESMYRQSQLSDFELMPEERAHYRSLVLSAYQRVQA